jgi:hypothetical protein
MIAPKREDRQTLSDEQLMGVATMAEDAIGNWVAREIEGDENIKRESLRVMRLVWESNKELDVAEKDEFQAEVSRRFRRIFREGTGEDEGRD